MDLGTRFAAAYIIALSGIRRLAFLQLIAPAWLKMWFFSEKYGFGPGLTRPIIDSLTLHDEEPKMLIYVRHAYRCPGGGDRKEDDVGE